MLGDFHLYWNNHLYCKLFILPIFWKRKNQPYLQAPVAILWSSFDEKNSDIMSMTFAETETRKISTSIVDTLYSVLTLEGVIKDGASSNIPTTKFFTQKLNIIVLLWKKKTWILHNHFGKDNSFHPHKHIASKTKKMGMNQNPWCIILQIENPHQSLISSNQDSNVHACITTVKPLRYWF